MNNGRITSIVSFLLLIIPLNIYIIGDWLGIGVQSSILNYKSTYLGTSLTHEITELQYVISGLYQGKTGLSSMAWFIGFLLLFVSCIFMLLRDYQEENVLIQKSGYIFIVAGLFFIGSCFLQYGILLSGPAGISIPVGVPLILFFGWWYQTYHQKEDSEEVPPSQMNIEDFEDDDNKD